MRTVQPVTAGIQGFTLTVQDNSGICGATDEPVRRYRLVSSADRILGIDIPKGRIPSLDGIRAVCVLFVLYSHLLGTERFLPVSVLPRTGDLGFLGVRIFFVISGFLITTLLLAELERTGSISLKWFYFRRTMRIFPAFYALIAAVGIATAAGFVALPLRDFIAALTYTINYVADPQWTLGHLWSLAVEEQFYVLWPAVLAFAGRRRAMRIAAGVICITPLIRFACLYIPAVNPLIETSFPTMADPLAAGCLLAGARKRLDNEQPYLRFLTSRWFWLVPPAILVLNMLPGTKLNMLITQSLLNISIAIVIDRFVRFPEGRAGAVLNWPPVRAVGVLSYSLYLWQQPFLNRASHTLFTAFPQNLFLAVICGYASYRLVEKPFLDWRVTLERRWKTPELCSVAAASAGNPNAPARALSSPSHSRWISR